MMIGGAPMSSQCLRTTMLVLLVVAASGSAVPPASETPIVSVTTIEDANDGVCNSHFSLREALAAAPPHGAIVFASGLEGTITLKDTLVIRAHVTINGPTANAITISGDNRRRVFDVAAGVHFTIRNLTIANGAVEGRPGSPAGSGRPGEPGETVGGAGLFNDGGVATIENCTFSNNSVRGGPGGDGDIGLGHTLWPYDDILLGKGGDGLGGAICNSGTLFLINSTFSGNRAKGGVGANRPKDRGGDGGNGYGGALYSITGASILSCTFAGNKADAGRGGIGEKKFADGRPGAASGADLYRRGALSNGRVLEINRSPAIVVKNTLMVGSSSGPNCDAEIGSGGYNIDDDGSCELTGPGDRTISNVKLEPLSDNGGPTWTHALPPDSPARDGGDPDGCTDHNGYPLATDQRGRPRTTGRRCDVGAFEISQ